MKFFVERTAALAVIVAIGANGQIAQAQQDVGNAYYQKSSTSNSASDSFDEVTASYCDSGGYGNGGYGGCSGCDGGCSDCSGGGCCLGGGGCGSGCGNDCGGGCSGGNGCSGGGCDLLGGCDSGGGGQLFFGVEYIYARANFSEAIAYLVQDTSQQGLAIDTFHSLDFEYESSYNFYGGYRLNCCGEEIRFNFTRMNSSASAVAPANALLPFEVAIPPGGQGFINANVDLSSYDIGYAKTIPLGSPLGGCDTGCGDCCDDGCGDGCSGCAPQCPAWDITWTGGVRFAQVDWGRSYLASGGGGAPGGANASSRMNFEGAGARFGLEGRRYLGRSGMFSIFLRGDISLLVGNVDIQTQRNVPQTGGADIVNIQTFSARNIIPVTEIRGGITGHLSRNTLFSAGYFLSAWHDLGFRDQFDFPVFLETEYDDANILGFDGLFVRIETAF